MNETLVFPAWAGLNKRFLIVTVVLTGFICLEALAQFVFFPHTGEKGRVRDYINLFESIMFGALCFANLFYLMPMEKKTRTELTPDSFRFIDHKDNVRTEILLADVVGLHYHKGLFFDQTWTVIDCNGIRMGFDQKLGRNTELAAALEARTGKSFVKVDSQGQMLAKQ